MLAIAARGTPSRVEYIPANELDNRSSSGEEERTANNWAATQGRKASVKTCRCVELSVYPLTISCRCRQISRRAAPSVARSAVHARVLCKDSSHGSKKDVVRVTPVGTGSPAWKRRIKDRAFPPTSSRRGRGVSLNRYEGFNKKGDRCSSAPLSLDTVRRLREALQGGDSLFNGRVRREQAHPSTCIARDLHGRQGIGE